LLRIFLIRPSSSIEFPAPGSYGGLWNCARAYGVSTHIWFAEALLVSLGFCITFQNASSNILLQESAPVDSRTNHGVIFHGTYGIMPLSAFILGIATRYAVVSRALMSAGIVCAFQPWQWWLHSPKA
jgi:hypothetical protein